MQTKQKSPSERFKRKVLMRWRWLAERGISLDEAAREIGVTTADLHRWSRGQEAEAPLFVPVQIEAESTARRGVRRRPGERRAGRGAHHRRRR